MDKPTRRQIVFNWMCGDPDFATRPDGYWGTSDTVEDVDALLAALDAASQSDRSDSGSGDAHAV